MAGTDGGKKEKPGSGLERGFWGGGFVVFVGLVKILELVLASGSDCEGL